MPLSNQLFPGKFGSGDEESKRFTPDPLPTPAPMRIRGFNPTPTDITNPHPAMRDARPDRSAFGSDDEYGAADQSWVRRNTRLHDRLPVINNRTIPNIPRGPRMVPSAAPQFVPGGTYEDQSLESIHGYLSKLAGSGQLPGVKVSGLSKINYWDSNAEGKLEQMSEPGFQITHSVTRPGRRKAETYTYDVGFNPHTGRLGITSANNQGGFFAILGETTIEGGQIRQRSAKEVLGSALQNAKGSIFKTFADPDDPDQNGAWQNRTGLTAQRETLWGASSTRIGKQYADERLNILGELRANGMDAAARGAASVAFNVGSYMGSLFPQRMVNGVTEFMRGKSIKRTQNQGAGDAVDLMEGVGAPVGKYQMPFRLASATGAGEYKAQEGYRTLDVYDVDPLLHPEGQVRTRQLMGASTGSRRVKIDEGALQAGTAYFDKMPAAISGDYRQAGNLGDFKAIFGQNAKTGTAYSVENVTPIYDRDGKYTGESDVAYRAYKDRLSFKFRGKNFGVAMGDGALPAVNGQRADLYGTLGSVEDVPMLALNTLGARLGNVDNVENWFADYADSWYQQRGSNEQMDAIFGRMGMEFSDDYATRRQQFMGMVKDGVLSPQSQELFVHGALEEFENTKQVVQRQNEMVSKVQLEAFMRGKLGREGVDHADMDFAGVFNAFSSNEAANSFEFNGERKSYFGRNGSGLDITPMAQGKATGFNSAEYFKLGNYQNVAYVTENFHLVRPESVGRSHLIKAESAKEMAISNPGLYDALNQMQSAGILRNDYAEMAQGLRLNAMNQDQRDDMVRSGNLGAIVDFDANVYNNVRETMDIAPSMTDDEISVEAMRAYDARIRQDYGLKPEQSYAMRFQAASRDGEYYLPALDALANSTQIGPTGRMTAGPGASAAEALAMAANFDGTDAAERDSAIYNVIRSNDEENPGLYEMLERTKGKANNFLQAAMGFQVPTIGGQAMGLQELADNEVLMSMRHAQEVSGLNRDQLLQMTDYEGIEKSRQAAMEGGMSREEAEQAFPALSLSTVRYPTAQPDYAFAPQRISFIEEEQRKGRFKDVLDPKQGFYTSLTAMMANIGDFDADYMFGIMNFAATKDGQVVGQNVDPLSSEEIVRRAQNVPESEYDKTMEKAEKRSNWQKFMSGARDKLIGGGIWSDAKGIMKDYDNQEVRSKGEIGVMHSAFLRTMRDTSLEIAQQGAGKDSETFNLLSEATGAIGAKAYQAPLDRMLTNEHFKNVASLVQNVQYGRMFDKKEAYDPNTGQAVPGSSSETGMYRNAIEEYMRLGLPGQDDEDYAEKEAAAQKDLIPALATTLMPVDEIQKHVEAGTWDQARGEMSQMISDFRESGKFDADKFLGMTNRQNLTSYALGREGDASSLSTYMGSIVGGINARFEDSAARQGLNRPISMTGAKGIAMDAYRNAKQMMGGVYKGMSLQGAMDAFGSASHWLGGIAGRFGKADVSIDEATRMAAPSSPVEAGAQLGVDPGSIDLGFSAKPTAPLFAGDDEAPPAAPPGGTVPSAELPQMTSGGGIDFDTRRNLASSLQQSLASSVGIDNKSDQIIENLAQTHGVSRDQALQIAEETGFHIQNIGDGRVSISNTPMSNDQVQMWNRSNAGSGGGSGDSKPTKIFENPPKPISIQRQAELKHAWANIQSYQELTASGKDMSGFNYSQLGTDINAVQDALHTFGKRAELGKDRDEEDAYFKQNFDPDMMQGTMEQLQASGVYDQIATAKRTRQAKPFNMSTRQEVALAKSERIMAARAGFAGSESLDGETGEKVISFTKRFKDSLEDLSKALEQSQTMTKEQAGLLKTTVDEWGKLQASAQDLSEKTGLSSQELTGLRGMDRSELEKTLGSKDAVKAWDTLYGRQYSDGSRGLLEAVGGKDGSRIRQLESAQAELEGGERRVDPGLKENLFKGIVGGYYAASAARQIFQQTAGESIKDMYAASEVQDAIMLGSSGERGSIRQLMNKRAVRDTYDGLAAEELYSGLLGIDYGMGTARTMAGAKAGMGILSGVGVAAAGLNTMGYGGAALGLGSVGALAGGTVLGITAGNALQNSGLMGNDFQNWSLGGSAKQYAQTAMRMASMPLLAIGSAASALGGDGGSVFRSITPDFIENFTSRDLETEERAKYAKELGVMETELDWMKQAGVNPQEYAQISRGINQRFGGLSITGRTTSTTQLSNADMNAIRQSFNGGAMSSYVQGMSVSERDAYIADFISANQSSTQTLTSTYGAIDLTRSLSASQERLGMDTAGAATSFAAGRYRYDLQAQFQATADYAKWMENPNTTQADIARSQIYEQAVGGARSALTPFLGEQTAATNTDMFASQVLGMNMQTVTPQQVQALNQISGVAASAGYYGRVANMFDYSGLAAMTPAQRDQFGRYQSYDLSLGRNNAASNMDAARNLNEVQQGRDLSMRSTLESMGFGEWADGVSSRLAGRYSGTQLGAIQSFAGQLAEKGMTSLKDFTAVSGLASRGQSEGVGTRYISAGSNYFGLLSSLGIESQEALSMAEGAAYTASSGQAVQRVSSVTSMLTGMGVSSRNAFNQSLGTVPGASNMQMSMFQKFMGGDPFMYSRFASSAAGQKLGLNPLVDVNTGLGVFQEQQWGLQSASAALSYQSQMFSIGQQRTNWQLDRAMTFGGQFKNPVTGQMQDAGMGSLAINRAMFNMGIEDQRFNFGQQRANFALSDEKQRWQFSMQERDMSRDISRQTRQFGREREQMETRYQWQIQDWSYGESSNQLQYAWQIEDFDRNIRYARGRERIDLERQKGRAVVQESMRREQSETERGRMDVTIEWQRQAQDEQEKYFRENIEMQKERLEREKEFYEKGRELSLERMKHEEEFYERRLVMQQEQQTNAEVMAEIQSKMQKDAIDHSAMVAQKQYAIQQQEIALSQELARRQAAESKFYAQDLPMLIESGQLSLKELFALFGSEALKIMNQIKGMAESIRPSTIMDRYTGRQITEHFNGGYVEPMPSFAAGGYTGPGGKYQEAGVVHGGEWVVPQQGALVVRGDNQESVSLLSRIVDELTKQNQHLQALVNFGPARTKQTILNNNGTQYSPLSMLTE